MSADSDDTDFLDNLFSVFDAPHLQSKPKSKQTNVKTSIKKTKVCKRTRKLSNVTKTADSGNPSNAPKAGENEPIIIQQGVPRLERKEEKEFLEKVESILGLESLNDYSENDQLEVEIVEAVAGPSSSQFNSLPRKRKVRRKVFGVDEEIIEVNEIKPILVDLGEDDDKEEILKDKQILSAAESLQSSTPKISLRTLETAPGSGCSHMVAVPSNAIYIPLEPVEDPVKIYEFKLDVFQEIAVTCIENYQSVLVSAHTSAGKTVVAEYAIAKGLKDTQRVIYTTPIKALSNQKYREFLEAFTDVGLITGDVTINPSASCLIMTTEILRNMLYRGSEIMREVGWVIFDEIHYMKDKERGVVWEETIILLPAKAHYVFLSATIPNAVQFAEWIAHLHKQPCNIIHTDYRPVPLHHYLYPIGGNGIHLVVDENGTFREDGFETAVASLVTSDIRNGHRHAKSNSEDSPCFKVIKMAMEHDLAPVIVFSFSKKDCEIYALQMAQLDFNTDEDKELVEEVFVNAVDILTKEDQKLPQVENLLPLLKRGIGIHHGGLLPLLKETIEILFSEGLVKVLFATETFAMGLNMPARTVLFTNVRKYDGKSYRWITPGEYIQMSGRAGRRGIDEKGVSILMIDEKICQTVGRNVFKGQTDPINSAFHLTYSMILNLMRLEEINPEYMMERSFYQFQNYSSIPTISEKISASEKVYNDLSIQREMEVSSYYLLRKDLAGLTKKFNCFINRPQHIIPFLQTGRMVYVRTGDKDFGWGIVVNFKKQDNLRFSTTQSEPGYIVCVLLHISCAGINSKSTSDLNPTKNGEKGEMAVVPVCLEVIEKVSQIRLYCSNDLTQRDQRMAVQKSIEDVVKRFPSGVPLLDPLNDMHIKDPEFDRIVESIKMFQEKLFSHPLYEDPSVARLYDLYDKKIKIYEHLVRAKAELKGAMSLLHMDELKCRKRILRRLGYSSKDDVISIKGKVACEITSADELLVTELIFHGLFVDLNVSQSVALLSCLVCDDRSKNSPKLPQELSTAFKLMQDTARQIAKVSADSKLNLHEDEYVDQFKPCLVTVVYEWCKGSSFAKLCEMTDIFEGSIIRCMRRLEELLRQMAQAVTVIGNQELANKFNEGAKLIKRDIVFAASLYL